MSRQDKLAVRGVLGGQKAVHIERAKPFGSVRVQRGRGHQPVVHDRQILGAINHSFLGQLKQHRFHGRHGHPGKHCKVVLPARLEVTSSCSRRTRSSWDIFGDVCCSLSPLIGVVVIVRFAPVVSNDAQQRANSDNIVELRDSLADLDNGRRKHRLMHRLHESCPVLL